MAQDAFALFAVVIAGAVACCRVRQLVGLYPVSGKVLVNGEPAVSATVVRPQRVRGPVQEPTPQESPENGTFT